MLLAVAKTLTDRLVVIRRRMNIFTVKNIPILVFDSEEGRGCGGRGG